MSSMRASRKPRSANSSSAAVSTLVLVRSCCCALLSLAITAPLFIPPAVRYIHHSDAETIWMMGKSVMYALQAEGLVKRFGQTTALAGVDLCAEPGTVLGVLGPNGAGKTTAIRVLATLTRPDGGTASVGGLDVVRQARRVRRLIALCGQHTTVDEELTGLGNLVMIGRLLDLRKADATRRATELLDRFGLADAANRRVATYSGGMRRRLDLAASLVSRPHVVFLDEPSVGLDPGRREDLWRMIRGLTAEGVTVLLTTQYLEEADALADRIAVIDDGRVVAQGTPADLKRLVG